MKRGRTPWMTRLSPALRRRVLALIDGRQKSSREIFDQCNLSRYTKRSTWEKTYARRRRERAARQEATQEDSGDTSAVSSSQSSSSSVESAIANCVDAITDALLAGRIGKLDVAKALRSLTHYKELTDVKAEALKMAREIHEQKLTELRNKLKAGADQQTEDGKSLTRDDVYSLIDAAMRGAA